MPKHGASVIGYWVAPAVRTGIGCEVLGPATRCAPDRRVPAATVAWAVEEVGAQHVELVMTCRSVAARRTAASVGYRPRDRSDSGDERRGDVEIDSLMPSGFRAGW